METGELEQAGRSHALYYLDLAERAAPELTGGNQQTWFAGLEWAHENLRAALRWLLEHDEGELALRMAAALGGFWLARGYIVEGRRELIEALARAPGADARLRARALTALGGLLGWFADELERPRAILTQALELARSSQDNAAIPRSLSFLGMLGLYDQEWSDRSRQYLEEAVAYWQKTGGKEGIACALGYLGSIEIRQGNHQEGTRLLEESLARYRKPASSTSWGSSPGRRL